MRQTNRGQNSSPNVSRVSGSVGVSFFRVDGEYVSQILVGGSGKTTYLRVFAMGVPRAKPSISPAGEVR